MASGNDRVTEARLPERRHRRNGCLPDALRLQLEACREDAGLAAIVVSDELGFCVAHSGCDGDHDELAARLPILAHSGAPEPAEGGDGSPEPPRPEVTVTTFSVGDATLHAGAVSGTAPTGASSASSAEVLARVASGFTRLLAQ